jgi:hypothetical protein
MKKKFKNLIRKFKNPISKVSAIQYYPPAKLGIM